MLDGDVRFEIHFLYSIVYQLVPCEYVAFNEACFNVPSPVLAAATVWSEGAMVPKNSCARVRAAQWNDSDRRDLFSLCNRRMSGMKL